MLTVLMIDDQSAVIDTIRDHLAVEAPDITLIGHNFDEAAAKLPEIRPDAIILDWFLGNPTTGEAEGRNRLETIWQSWFCPVVIYSAGEVDLVSQDHRGHPFVIVQGKGGGSEKKLVEHLTAFRPHVEALQQVADEVERAKRSVLRDLARLVFAALPVEDSRRDVFRRAARRRIAAIADDAQALGDESNLPWEQYIFPVLSSHPITGDILHAADADPKVPSNYRVILTPTCDLVPRKGGKCKVTHVLAGKCNDPTKFVREGLSMPVGTNRKKIEETLNRAMNEAHQSGWVIYPECTGVVPLMALNLRDLELIPESDIGMPADTGKKYHRIASVDSPFREYIAWGFLQIGCRPGIPPRNSSALVQALAALCDNQAQATK